MTHDFWQGKRVLVTGHTGFKGSWLSLWLQRLGARVTGLALEPSTEPNLFETAHVVAGMTSVIGDIVNFDEVLSVMADTRPEIVFHLAAQSLVRLSYEAPVKTYATNVLGTVNVLEAVRRVPGVRAVVVVTSDKCYENADAAGSFREDAPMGGYDPYSSSKGCAELVTAAYRRSFFSGSAGPRVGSARAGNVIGGGDWAQDRVVPDLMKAFMAGQSAVIRNPKATRPWQHVLDPLAGYLLLAETLYEDPRASEGWNFGPDASDVRDVGWVADSLARRWGHGARWQIDNAVHPYEARTLQLDCTKAKARLGWTPQISLEHALDATVSWYKAFDESPATAAQLTFDEIDAYPMKRVWQLA